MSSFHRPYRPPEGSRLLLMGAVAVLAACSSGESGQAARQQEGRDLVAEAKAREEEQKALREREAEELGRLIAAMQPVYDEMEAVRTSATRLHDRLVRRLKRQTMPQEHAPEITRIMSDANYLLKNPRQLGAFRGVEGVQEELLRMQQTADQLEQVAEWVPEQR